MIKSILALIILIGLMVLAARVLLRKRPEDTMSDAELMERHNKGHDDDDR